MNREATPLSIGKATYLCAASGEVLAAGTTCMSAIREGAEQRLERLDFSMAAWLAGARPEGMVCFWKTVMPEPDRKRGIVIDDEAVEEIFERLAGDDRPNRVAIRWLLAMILLRKRRLKHLRVEHRDKLEVWLFARRGQAEGAAPVEVQRPTLDDSAVQALADELGEIASFDG
ncbi:MAG: hypothetical protein K8R92_09645 [Planctomycetes bacterium]|nr:hypothetical protein [Planctomycetota bacterium]